MFHQTNKTVKWEKRASGQNTYFFLSHHNYENYCRDTMEADYRVLATILTNQMRKLYGKSAVSEGDANGKACEINEMSDEKKRGPTEI